MPDAPQEIGANLRYRKEIIKLGNESKSAREEIILAASRDPIWFISTFLWTLNFKDHPDCPQRPFIPYQFQQRAVKKINAAIGKHSLVAPKTRAVGGTYIILATFFHRWRFRQLQSFLLASAKEDRVDEYDNPDCLFYKLDYWLSNLPPWMRPVTERVSLRLANLENDSVFNGETTNKDMARGGRRTAVLADETAAMPHSDKIMDSLSQVTNCNIYLSTPQGAFGGFYQLYEKYRVECPERVLAMHWTEHPVYSAGLYHDANGKPRSPWYDEQCRSSLGPRQIAQELDIDFVAAGGMFFEPGLIERLIAKTKDPLATGELPFDEEGHHGAWKIGPHGRLHLWCDLKDDRPPKAEYICGLDIATGKGGDMSSQSVCSIVNKNTGLKVAEFKTSHMEPPSFSRQAIAISRWFHDAKMIWGSQGPGGSMELACKTCKYHSFFRRPGGDRKPGFVESAESKLTLFSNYQDALHRGRFINLSKKALEECRQFIFARDTVVHSKAVQLDTDPEHAGKLHGDICVADSLAAHLLPHQEPKSTASAAEPEIGTFAWRQREVQRISDRNRQEDWLTVADPLASVE